MPALPRMDTTAGIGGDLAQERATKQQTHSRPHRVRVAGEAMSLSSLKSMVAHTRVYAWHDSYGRWVDVGWLWGYLTPELVHGAIHNACVDRFNKPCNVFMCTLYKYAIK